MSSHGVTLSVCWALGLYALSQLLPEVKRWIPERLESLDSALLLIQDLRECLMCGELPPREDWSRLAAIPEPWGTLAHESIAELRDQGLPVLPTLERLETLLKEQIAAAAQAKARMAQAWGQAIVCGCFVPAVALALYWLLPGVSELGGFWWLLVMGALLLNAFGFFWLLALGERARWAGLSKDQRVWWPALLCFSERLLASLRSGAPPDLAWSRAMPTLARSAYPLVLFWGSDFWTHSSVVLGRSDRSSSQEMQSVMQSWGLQLRDSLQRSLIEGHACAERLDGTLHALKQDWHARVERELALLGTRALQPLFLCVAPAVLGLLGVALFTSVRG